MEDALFAGGKRCDHAFFYLRGVLSYVQEPSTSPVLDEEEHDIVDETWLCEAGLWTEWTHVGSAMARAPCQLFSLSADGVVKLLAKHRLIRELTSEYSYQFYTRLCLARPPLTDWPTDVSVPFTDYSDIFFALTPDEQVSIGLLSLANANRAELGKFSNMLGRDLQEEVKARTAGVLVDGRGRLERVTALVVLAIKREGGFLLVQLARGSGEECKPCCRLPGGRPEQNETPSGTRDRILTTKLAPFEPCLEYGACRQHVRDWDAPNGIRNKFIRYVCHAEYVGCTTFTTFRGDTAALDAREPSFPDSDAKWEPPRKRWAHLRHLFQRDVFLIADAEVRRWYTWVKEKEMLLLQQPESETFLGVWLETLTPRVPQNHEIHSEGTRSEEKELESLSTDPGAS